MRRVPTATRRLSDRVRMRTSSAVFLGNIGFIANFRLVL